MIIVRIRSLNIVRMRSLNVPIGPMSDLVVEPSQRPLQRSTGTQPDRKACP